MIYDVNTFDNNSNHNFGLLVCKMADSSSDDDSVSPARKISKKYQQKFRFQWLSDPSFKDWLVAPAVGKSDCSCKFCCICFTSSKTAIQRQSESAQHKMSSSGARHQLSLAACAKKSEERTTYKERTTVQVAAFIAERNLSLSISSSLLDLLIATAPKDTIESMGLKEIQMAATKCTNIIRPQDKTLHRILCKHCVPQSSV